MKFSSVFENVKDLYNNTTNETDSTNNNFKNISEASFNSLPEPNEMYDHLKSILNGKIGQLATEFGEELYNELDLKDLENSGAKNINDIYKNLFKNPSKIFKVIEKMGTKLDEKIKSGASLLQIYTGMVYEGPGIVKKIKSELIDILEKEKIKNVSEIVGAGS